MADDDIKQIEALLTKPKMAAGDLKMVLEKVPGLKKFKPRRGFPEGVINPDVLRVEYDLTPAQFKTFVSDFGLSATGIVRQWRVFPRGIINPDQFRVVIDFGRPYR